MFLDPADDDQEEEERITMEAATDRESPEWLDSRLARLITAWAAKTGRRKLGIVIEEDPV